MPRYSSATIDQHESDVVEIVCDCGRAFEPFSKAALIQRYGPTTTMADLRHELARCERRGQPGQTCKVRYRRR